MAANEDTKKKNTLRIPLVTAVIIGKYIMLEARDRHSDISKCLCGIEWNTTVTVNIMKIRKHLEHSTGECGYYHKLYHVVSKKDPHSASA